jgi:hypothetical protein
MRNEIRTITLRRGRADLSVPRLQVGVGRRGRSIRRKDKLHEITILINLLPEI